MNGLSLVIIVGLLLFSWWQWAEKDRYREMYEDSKSNSPVDVPETVEGESLALEYDPAIPHPFK